MTWLQAQARMRQVAKEAVAAQASEEAFKVETKRKGKGKGKGGGRGKGKGRGRGKGKGRGRGKVQNDEQHDEDDDDMLKCTEDLDGEHGASEENIGNRESERKTPITKHVQHAASTTTPMKSTKPPALKRLALLRSKSRSSSSLSASVQGAQTKKLRTKSTKRRLEFEDVEAKESTAPAPLTIPVKKRRCRNTGGKGQGVVTETKQTAEPKEAPDAPPAKKSEPSVERQAQKEPRVVV